LKNPYETRTNDENNEGQKAPSDDDEDSDSENDNSGDSNSDNSGDSGDNNNNDNDSEKSSSEDYDSQDSGNDREEPPSNREEEDVGSFYEDHFDDDVDYYDGDIEDDAEAKGGDIEDVVEAEDEEVKDDVEDYDEYLYGRPLDWSCINDVSSKLGPQYDKPSGEILELSSFHNLELDSLTPYTEEEDDIDARLATLDRKLMIHSFRNLTLQDLEDEDERMEGNKLEYFPQYICPSNKGKQDLFREWMVSIERLDAYFSNKLANMEVDGKSIVHMDEGPTVLMLKEEGTYWEPATIVKATTELKNWAWEGVAHPMEDSLEKIKTIEPFTPAKNIISILI